MGLKRKSIAALFVATIAAAGCGSDRATAPHPVSFDASDALARVEPVAAIFDQQIFSSFTGAEGFFESFFRSPITATLALTPRVRGGIQLGIARSPTLGAERVPANTIPDDEKGKTFVWDANTRMYVPDPTVVGAPALGVRFLLYVWDPVNGPILPLTRVGYVDIAPPDGADASGDEAEVVIERDAPRAIVADFVVSHRSSAGIDSFSIQGSATDTRTVALIALDGTYGGAAGQHHLIFSTNLSSSPPGVSTMEHLVYDQPTASQSGHLELDYDGHRLTDETVSTGADIKFDGNLYAHVLFSTGVSDQTRYLHPDGTSLSSQEIASVNALLDRVVVTNFFWINLAYP
ncbi:MAG: hypothetical protein ACJ796_10710 [Gemmatimonadaceae bacterium]